MTISIKSRYTDALSARKIQESDFIDYFHHYDDDICRVLKSTKFKLYKDFKKWITKQLQDRHIYILENQKLGFIGSFGYEVFSELAYIHYWVSKKYQGLGYGLYLINFLKNKATENCIHALFAEVDEQNKASQKLLTRAGFVSLDQFPEFVEDKNISYAFFTGVTTYV